MAWHSFIVIFNLYLGVKHSRFYGRLILITAATCYLLLLLLVLHWRMICRPNWFRWENMCMCLCTAQWIRPNILLRALYWQIPFSSQQQKKFPENTIVKIKCDCSQIKMTLKWWARQPWPYILKLTMKWLVFHGKHIFNKSRSELQQK